MHVAIYGAGGHGRDVELNLSALRAAVGADTLQEDLVCFIDDCVESGTMIRGVPVLRPREARANYRDLHVICAQGEPKVREKVYQDACSFGFRFFSVIHPTAIFRPDTPIGIGTVINAGAILAADVKVGRHVIINQGATVGHDCVLEDFATLNPGCNLTGRVHVGYGAFIGIGANVVCRSTTVPLEIGEYAIVGAGAVVLEDVAPGTMVCGVPAVLKQHRRAA